jgi:hypothetical protein
MLSHIDAASYFLDYIQMVLDILERALVGEFLQ